MANDRNCHGLTDKIPKTPEFRFFGKISFFFAINLCDRISIRFPIPSSFVRFVEFRFSLYLCIYMCVCVCVWFGRSQVE